MNRLSCIIQECAKSSDAGPLEIEKEKVQTQRDGYGK